LPNPHFDISITQRSKNQSAVAGAAYQSGTSLFSEYDQKRKNYTNKQGVLYSEIMLPSNAPPEYVDRETLWNAVEAVENQWNSQLARRFVLALPREVPEEQYPQMVREYCQKHFVSAGMCCDFAIHNTARNNPHAHVMLTLRAMDEQGKWLPKSRKVYDLDENGERIRLPSGNWKSHKENTTDWNEQWHAEIWRTGWADIQNQYLEAASRPERVDLRSYERQGIDQIPTVHMGPAVTQMERRGIETNIGNLNRDIKSANRLLAVIRNTIKGLRDWIAELSEARKEAKEAWEQENASPSLASLLNQYMDMRKEERSDWSRSGQNKGATADVQAVSHAVAYLSQHDIVTLQNLDDALQSLNEKAGTIRAGMRSAESRMKTINSIQKAANVCVKHKAVHDKYLKIGWKIAKTAYEAKHKDELSAFNKSYRFLKKQGVGLDVNLDELQSEYAELSASNAEDKERLEAIQTELKPLKEIRYWINKVTEPQSENAPKRESVTARLRQKQQAIDEREAQRKPTKTKKQNMEL
jgi:predicted  nucleic acid-binding Zn-ribbon protein